METTRIDDDAENGTPGATAAAAAVEEAAFDVAELVDQHPVATLATAVGLGYVLGGGLFTRFTSRAVAWGLRLGLQFAVLPALERELTNLAGSAGRSLKGANEVGTDAGDRTQH